MDGPLGSGVWSINTYQKLWLYVDFSTWTTFHTKLPPKLQINILWGVVGVAAALAVVIIIKIFSLCVGSFYWHQWCIFGGNGGGTLW